MFIREHSNKKIFDLYAQISSSLRNFHSFGNIITCLYAVLFCFLRQGTSERIQPHKGGACLCVPMSAVFFVRSNLHLWGLAQGIPHETFLLLHCSFWEIPDAIPFCQPFLKESRTHLCHSFSVFFQTLLFFLSSFLFSILLHMKISLPFPKWLSLSLFPFQQFSAHSFLSASSDFTYSTMQRKKKAKKPQNSHQNAIAP